MSFEKGCKKCGGSLQRIDGEVKCISCGRVARTVWDMKRYYEEHKDEILKDRQEIGDTETRKKWRIPSGSFTGLMNRWMIFTPPDKPPPSSVLPEPTTFKLPILPEWSEDWPESIKSRWLDIWVILITKGNLDVLEDVTKE